MPNSGQEDNDNDGEGDVCDTDMDDDDFYNVLVRKAIMAYFLKSILGLIFIILFNSAECVDFSNI